MTHAIVVPITTTAPKRSQATLPRAGKVSKHRTRACYNCGKTGHLARDCRKPSGARHTYTAVPTTAAVVQTYHFEHRQTNPIIPGSNDVVNVHGGSGHITKHAGNGIMNVYGGSGRITIHGGNGVFNIYGGSGTITMHGGSGIRNIHSGNGTVTIDCESGIFNIHSGNGTINIRGYVWM